MTPHSLLSKTVWLLLSWQHARALEAFARLMPHAPEQLVPLITTSFQCMAVIRLEQNGQLPPPAKVTWRWKEEAMARISMSKVNWTWGWEALPYHVYSICSSDYFCTGQVPGKAPAWDCQLNSTGSLCVPFHAFPQHPCNIHPDVSGSSLMC